MRAAWWWIDRWRQSTAYTDMTAEEQGLYRNLLDEVWLRDDHVIPDDPRILAKVSGDPEAWSRCSKRVLGWMTRVETGWTHTTAMEVIDQSRRRAENQKRYREKRHNKADNAADNKQHNKPDSPSQSPSQSKEQNNGLRTTEPADKPPAWNTEAAADFKAQYGGNPPAQFFAQVKPVVSKHGWDTVRPVLKAVLEETPLEYLNLPKVLGVRVEASKAGVPQRPQRKLAANVIDSPIERNQRALEAILRERGQN